MNDSGEFVGGGLQGFKGRIPFQLEFPVSLLPAHASASFEGPLEVP